MSAKIRIPRAARKHQHVRRRAARHKLKRQLECRQRRIQRRLDPQKCNGGSGPVLAAGNIHYEISDKFRGIACGGIGLMHQMAGQLGLPEAINDQLHLLKVHLPYHESDHVLNLAYHILSGGTCLEDLELRRNDENYLDALGAVRIPDPTTAGDFCRRFSESHIRNLLEALHQVRRKVWAQQPPEFFERATIEMDGVLVETGGECKQGMDISYQGTWGYHPLIVSLAETGELLSLVNRSGNRPSHEGAAAEADRAIQLCQAAGFRSILLRGDTDFSQTKHLDRWNAIPNLQFHFGMGVQPNLHVLGDALDPADWQPLVRPPRYEVKTQPRRRPPRVKEEIVRQREFKNICRESEEVAEFDYQPVACRQAYRLIVVRKNLRIEKGQRLLNWDYRYFIYITNDRVSTPAEIVFSANDRCNQENLNAQLKGSVRSLRAPLDTLLSNWAWMVMTALAWNMKAWWALLLPASPGRWQARHQADKQRVLRMEFRTFQNAFIQIPCQVVRTGRRLIYRLLAWNVWQPILFRWLHCMQC